MFGQQNQELILVIQILWWLHNMPKIKLSDVQKPNTDISLESFGTFSSMPMLETISGSVTTFTISGSTVSTTTTTYGYASASDVAAFSRNLLGSEINFSSSTSPNLTNVQNWLSSGCGIIETKLSSHGYTVPVAAGTQLREWIRNLNALYAAAQAEMSRINVTLSPGERTRGQVFEEMFWEQLNNLCTLDLVGAGATTNSSGNSILGQTMFVSGTSVTSKDSYKTDSDRVKPRFSIGMFSMPGTVNHNSAEDDTE